MKFILNNINYNQKINFNDKSKIYYKIIYSKIKINNKYKKLYKFQYDMLFKLINSRKTFMSNQSNVLYYEHCFNKNIKFGNYNYNMILTKNEKIFLINIDTGKIRNIIYKKKLVIKKKI